MKILVIEDDRIINEGVQAFLCDNGYKVFSAFSGEEGLDLLSQEDVDLVLLDIMLPGIDGIEVLKRIKAEKDIPIIMLTALEDERTQVKSFDNLCDDYISKPFSLILLKKRIEAVLRRSSTLDSKIWTYKKARVDFDAFEAYYDEKDAGITPKEVEILLMLLENSGKVLSRGQIIDRIWDGSDEEPFERIIDVYIKNLRKKLNLDCIYTVKGIGYKLQVGDENE